MTEALASGMPSDIEVVRQLSAAEDRGLLALSIPEAVTDAVAERIVEASGVGNAAEFVALVRACDFVVDRDVEWRLTDEARRHLQPVCLQTPGLWREINTVLFEFASFDHVPDQQFDPLPAYLRSPAGHAYHLAAIDQEAGLERYSELAVAAEVDAPSPTTWLAGRLARDQEVLGVLPEGAPQLKFLSAMVEYCTGSKAIAVAQLREIADEKGSTMPIAVACHLVGRHDANRDSGVHFRVTEKRLRRSMRIGESLNNARHVAQVEHTLALLLLIHDRPKSEPRAFDLLEHSLNTLTREGDSFGVAKVLHTYGQALGRSEERARQLDARTLLVESLRLGRWLGKRRHEAAVMRSLAEVLERTDPGLAADAFAASERMGDGPNGGRKAPPKDRNRRSRRSGRSSK